VCGRFSLYEPSERLVTRFGVDEVAPGEPEARYNVAPSQQIFSVVCSRDGTTRRLGTLKWGLVPSWAKEPSVGYRMINARAETVASKPMFRDAFKRTRCLIPMSGYYEWQNTPSGKQPWYFTARDGSPLLTAAGLWDEWKNRETGERLKSCTMIVAEPSDFAAEIHDRMPVFLSEDQFAPWLSGEAGAEVLKPAPNDFLQRWPVSKRVNSSKAVADDATLIERVELAAA